MTLDDPPVVARAFLLVAAGHHIQVRKRRCTRCAMCRLNRQAAFFRESSFCFFSRYVARRRAVATAIRKTIAVGRRGINTQTAIPKNARTANAVTPIARETILNVRVTPRLAASLWPSASNAAPDLGYCRRSFRNAHQKRSPKENKPIRDQNERARDYRMYGRQCGFHQPRNGGSGDCGSP